MVTSQSKSVIERWDRGFAALSKFRAREGHRCPSRRHVEGRFKLGHVRRATGAVKQDRLCVECSVNGSRSPPL
jgi:hypothetical protein